jgi:hypothetical protein
VHVFWPNSLGLVRYAAVEKRVPAAARRSIAPDYHKRELEDKSRFLLRST